MLFIFFIFFIKTLLKTHRKITYQIIVIILIIKTLLTISFDKKEEHLDLF